MKLEEIADDRGETRVKEEAIREKILNRVQDGFGLRDLLLR